MNVCYKKSGEINSAQLNMWLQNEEIYRIQKNFASEL